MSKAFESGKSLADLVAAKLPEAIRAKFQEALTAPEAAEALTLLGDSALARADYSRSMDEIRDKTEKLKEQEAVVLEDYQNLQTWATQNKDQLARVPTLEAEIARLQGKPAPPAEVKPPVAGLTEEKLAEILSQRDAGYADVLGLGIEVGAKHLHTFGEPPDMRGVITLAKKHGISLEAAYQQKYGDKLAERAKTEYDAGIEKRVAERLAEERKQTNQPFPLRNASPSVLDVLAQPDRKPSDFGLDAAVAEYERLQSNGQGS
jgi:hypothetical protein